VSYVSNTVQEEIDKLERLLDLREKAASANTNGSGSSAWANQVVSADEPDRATPVTTFF
jgi:hypothetical protein